MKRYSNIELCRIISILLVLLVHSAFAANGFPSELNKNALWLILLESISIVGVNVFIFISGYFSIKLKPKTIYSLVFVCAFYFVLLTGASVCIGEPFKYKNLLFVSNSHYFIVDYIGLALLSPILNNFVEFTNKRKFLGIIIVLFLYQTYFGFVTGASRMEFDFGYSLMSYSIIYLIARYVRIYGVPNLISKYSGSLYLLSTLIILLLACFSLKIGYPGVLYHIYAYNNPIVIFQSIFFFLYFEKKAIKENKSINMIAKSTLGILLFHASIPAVPTIWKFMKEIYQGLMSDFGILTMFIWPIIIIIIAIMAILIDQIRIYLSEKVFNIINKKYYGI